MSALAADMSFLMDFPMLRNMPAISFLISLTSEDLPEPAGESGSSISSEQQEEAGELSRTEVVCESGEVINLEALACLLRMLGLALSAVMNRLMEPTADWWEAEDFRDACQGLSEVPML